VTRLAGVPEKGCGMLRASTVATRLHARLTPGLRRTSSVGDSASFTIRSDRRFKDTSCPRTGPGLPRDRNGETTAAQLTCLRCGSACHDVNSRLSGTDLLYCWNDMNL
jgi:hypothetical protein